MADLRRDQMYPEEGAGGADLPPMEGPSLKDRLTYHLEGLIPVILVVIVGLLVGCQFGVLSDVPVVGGLCRTANISGGSEPARMLIIGSPSQYTLKVLNDNPDLVQYQTKSAEALGNNPENILANLSNYRIVMLDQSQSSNKEVTRALGEAVQQFVGKGGHFVLVGNSGIRRPDSFDILGWKANFNKTVGVDCPYTGINNIPSCLNLQPVVGKMYPGAAGYKHPIMNGIEVIPILPGQSQRFDALADISVVGKEVAYIVADGTNKPYAGIVEANTVLGKSLFFNYDPGMTPGVMQNTLRYLK